MASCDPYRAAIVGLCKQIVDQDATIAAQYAVCTTKDVNPLTGGPAPAPPTASGVSTRIAQINAQMSANPNNQAIQNQGGQAINAYNQLTTDINAEIALETSLGQQFQAMWNSGCSP